MVVFLLQHICVSLALFAAQSKVTAKLFPLSLAGSITSVTISLTIILLFKLKPECYGDYIKGFKDSTFGRHYYWLLIANRVLLMTLLVLMNELRIIGFVAMSIPLVNAAVLVCKKPYLR